MLGCFLGLLYVLPVLLPVLVVLPLPRTIQPGLALLAIYRFGPCFGVFGAFFWHSLIFLCKRSPDIKQLQEATRGPASN